MKDDDVIIGIRFEYMRFCFVEEVMVLVIFELEENFGEYVLVYMKIQDGVEFIVKFEMLLVVKNGDMLYFIFVDGKIYVFDKVIGVWWD